MSKHSIVKNKKGTVIIAFAYFVVFILLPLLAVGYDFAMLHVFKTHLDNIAQLAALSCQPHEGNEFSKNGDCQKVMVQIAAINLNIEKLKNGVSGTTWQARGADEGKPALNEQSLGSPSKIKSIPEMQTPVFRLNNTKFFKLTGTDPSVLNRLVNDPSNEIPISANDPSIRKTFSFDAGANSSKKTISHFTISGTYYPLFTSFLGGRFENLKKGIVVKSSPVTARAVTASNK